MTSKKIKRVYRSGEGMIIEMSDAKQIRVFKKWESQKDGRGLHTYMVIPQKNSGWKITLIKAKTLPDAVKRYSGLKELKKE